MKFWNKFYENLLEFNDLNVNFINYDKTTCEYVTHRVNKTDPITHEVLSDKIAFKYYYMWDPYTCITQKKHK